MYTPWLQNTPGHIATSGSCLQLKALHDVYAWYQVAAGLIHEWDEKISYDMYYVIPCQQAGWMLHHEEHCIAQQHGIGKQPPPPLPVRDFPPPSPSTPPPSPTALPSASPRWDPAILCEPFLTQTPKHGEAMTRAVTSRRSEVLSHKTPCEFRQHITDINNSSTGCCGGTVRSTAGKGYRRVGSECS